MAVNRNTRFIGWERKPATFSYTVIGIDRGRFPVA